MFALQVGSTYAFQMTMLKEQKLGERRPKQPLNQA